MNLYDPEKAARVWQRVQGASVDTAAVGLQGLLIRAATDAQTYLALSRHYTGKPSALLQQMARQEQWCVACLKGICTLVRGAAPSLPSSAPPTGSPEATLRKCYRNALQSLADSDTRRTDPEYGQVFSVLADQKRTHCMHILALLGTTVGK